MEPIGGLEANRLFRDPELDHGHFKAFYFIRTGQVVPAETSDRKMARLFRCRRERVKVILRQLIDKGYIENL